jgi:hypothetical protein
MIWPHRKASVELRKSEARQVAHRAEVGLKQVKAQRPEVVALVNRLVALREQNHFAEALTVLFSGGEDNDRRANS